MVGSSLPPEVVRVALDRIVTSRALGGASRSRDLLRYLVEALLSGRSEQLKEYTVGAEALGRGDGFDPRVDSIARAEASRLRNRLTLYYLTEGRDDEVVISLPVGGYVPTVSRTSSSVSDPAQPHHSRHSTIFFVQSALLIGAGALASAVILGVILILLAPKTSRLVPPAPISFDVALGAPGELLHAAGTDLVISRDGKMMVMQISQPDGSTALYSRPMNALAAKELPGTAGAFSPFLSPDGRWVAFVVGSQLKKTLVDGGGSPVTLSPALSNLGGSWSEDGDIITTSDTDSALWRVSAEGGTPSRLVDFGPGAPKPRFPQLLPDGKGVLFTATANNSTGSIDVVRLDGSGHKKLLDRGTNARYLPSGHIVFANGPQLFAVKFDVGRLEIQGAPWLAVEGVAYLEAFAVSNFDVADDGTLIYVGSKTGGLSTIDLIDETGRSKTLVSEPARRIFPRLSPDGSRLIYAQADGTSYDLWSYDMQTGDRTRFSSGQGGATSPAVSADGNYIFYLEDGMAHLAVRRADGSGNPRVLLDVDGAFWSPSPDGKTLVFQQNTPGQHLDLWSVPVDTSGEVVTVGAPTKFFGTRFTETQPTFSPDGRWISYVSNEAGTAELYVRAYPDNGSSVKISSGRGRLAAWAKTGPYIFYENSQRHIMRLRYRVEGGIFIPEATTEWLGKPLVNMSVLPNYALANDGKSIVALMPIGDASADARDHVTVVRNFFDVLRSH